MAERDAIATTEVETAGAKCSFDAHTLVVMADGTSKPISHIARGDIVMATNPATGQTTAQTVTALHVNNDTDLADLTITQPNHHTATIHTTQNHPFWDLTRHQWVNAGQLRPGDYLQPRQPATITVTAIHAFTQPHTMYNLTVDNVHTYYVVAGDTPVLVHNCPADVPYAHGSKIGPTSGSPNFEDTSVSPGEGWEWRGPGAPGTPNRGAWYNPATKETLHPDLEHIDPIGPHYDYRAPDGTFYRIYPDGRVEPK
jgi:hypothetical protein